MNYLSYFLLTDWCELRTGRSAAGAWKFTGIVSRAVRRTNRPTELLVVSCHPCIFLYYLAYLFIFLLLFDYISFVIFLSPQIFLSSDVIHDSLAQFSSISYYLFSALICFICPFMHCLILVTCSIRYVPGHHPETLPLLVC